MTNRESAQRTQRDSLNAQQHLPAYGRKYFDRAIRKPAEYHPGPISLSQSIRDLCSLLRVVKYIPKSSPSDQQLKQHDADAFHTKISPRVMLSEAKHLWRFPRVSWETDQRFFASLRMTTTHFQHAG